MAVTPADLLGAISQMTPDQQRALAETCVPVLVRQRVTGECQALQTKISLACDAARNLCGAMMDKCNNPNDVGPFVSPTAADALKAIQASLGL